MINKAFNFIIQGILGNSNGLSQDHTIFYKMDIVQVFLQFLQKEQKFPYHQRIMY